ncbi:MAG: hypothetical protein HDQ87_04560 [Clostridia bacterium]|nr:hypothetical protein [Clostridia bacterium]
MGRELGSVDRDDVYGNTFRAIVQDAPALLIPIVDRMFGTCYTDKAVIRFSSDQTFFEDCTSCHSLEADLHLVVAEDGAEEDFLFEVQRTPDSETFIRIPQYILGADMEVVVEETADGEVLAYAKLPRAGLICLRAPDELESPVCLYLQLSAGTAVSEMPILQIDQITLDDILQEPLIALTPFYLFRYASGLAGIEQDEARRDKLLSEYCRIASTLKACAASGEISRQESELLTALTEKAVDALAPEQPLIREGVKEILRKAER